MSGKMTYYLQVPHHIRIHFLFHGQKNFNQLTSELTQTPHTGFICLAI